MSTEPRIVYPYRDNGTKRAWSVPYRGEEPADAVQVEYDPGAAEPWTGYLARGGWRRAPLSAADLEQMLVGVELRDLRGLRHR